MQEAEEILKLRQLLQDDVDRDTVVGPAAAVAPDASATDIQDPPTPLGAPPNITIVNTPLELRKALKNGAVDIEIRSHMDMRSLKLDSNPMIQGVETAINRKKLALLYAQQPLRSIRVRCHHLQGFPGPHGHSAWPAVGVPLLSLHQITRDAQLVVEVYVCQISLKFVATLSRVCQCQAMYWQSPSPKPTGFLLDWFCH